MKKSLKNKEWKEFNIDEIFNINTGANVPKQFLKKGRLPRISATEQNNGISLFTKKSAYNNYRTLNNFISVSFLGAVFYHPYTASLDMKIHAVQIKNKVFNKYLAEFIVYTLKRSFGNTSYGNQVSSTDLPNKKVFLPVTKENEPDYAFMENYMREKEQEKINAYKNYISKRISELEKTESVISITEKEWLDFKLKYFFDTEKGNQNKMADLINGDIPLISAKNGSNGLKSFVKKNNKKKYAKNSLTLNNDGDGGAGIAYYQPYRFLLDSHVTALYPKEDFNEYILLFISRCITKQRNKFGHGYSLTNNRLKSFKLMLPINESKEPDYVFMENYMKRIELNKLNKYLDYIETR